MKTRLGRLRGLSGWLVDFSNSLVKAVKRYSRDKDTPQPWTISSLPDLPKGRQRSLLLIAPIEKPAFGESDWLASYMQKFCEESSLWTGFSSNAALITEPFLRYYRHSEA